jgi:hypothetical protein
MPKIRSRASGAVIRGGNAGLLRRRSDITQEHRMVIVRHGKSFKGFAGNNRAKRRVSLLQLPFSLGMHMCAQLMLKRQFSALYC